ncbi:MAG: outer membrane beta-barrel protein [Bacteroidota bacterium]
MRCIPLLLLFLLPTLATSQSTFNWGINAYPHLAGTRVLSFGQLSNRQLAEINEREITRFGYGGGVFAQWKGEKLAFQLGLSYLDTGYRTIRDTIPTDAPRPANATEQRLLFRYQYIELPVEIQFYQNFRDKYAFFFMLGASFSYNLNNTQTTIFYTGDTDTRDTDTLPIEEFNRFNYAFQSGLGFEAKLNNKLGLFIEPVFQFWLQEVFKERELNRSLYTFGLKVGLRFFSQ